MTDRSDPEFDFDDELTLTDPSAPLVDYGCTPAELLAEQTAPAVHRPSGEATGVTKQTNMATLPETRSAAQRTLAREVQSLAPGWLPVLDPRTPSSRDEARREARASAPEAIPARRPEESRSLASEPGAGVKYDGGKSRFSLLPLKALRAVVRVLDAGARKYAPDNWRKVENARERYYNAAHRHIGDWWEGQVTDPETGEHHLAHAICCLIFLIALEPETAKTVECTGCGFAKQTRARDGAVNTVFVKQPDCPIHGKDRSGQGTCAVLP